MEAAVIAGNPAIGCPVPVPIPHLPAEAPSSCVNNEGTRGVDESCHDPPDELSQMETGRCWRRKGDASLLDLSDLDFCPFLIPSVSQGPITSPRISRSPIYRCAALCAGSTMGAEPKM